MKKLLAAALVAGLLAVRLLAAPLTNADVIKMTDAKLDDGIIIAAIENSEPKFDTSATGLIELSTAKVSQAVITAMIKRGNASATPTAPAASSAAAPSAAASAPAAVEEAMSPSEVILMVGEEKRPMRYLNPQMRTAARALGLGGVASYAVLRGTAAKERVKGGLPSFLVSVPNQAQVESYVTVASFAVRPNGSREVLVGGGYMSYSSGIHPDRVMAVDSVKWEDQSRAQKGFTIYKVTPRRALNIGEYALILYTGEMQGMVGAWFAGTGNSYFDFGVD
jgi:hypothetical protein